MKDFRELTVWQKSHQLTLETYRITTSFPRQEAYGLTSQMRRAAVSVCANIVEGSNRGSDREFARGCQIAFASAAELEYFILLAKDLTLLKDPEVKLLQDQVTEVKRMLAALMKKLTAEC